MYHNITINQLIDVLQDFSKAGLGEREIRSIGCVCAGEWQGMTTPYTLQLRDENARCGIDGITLYFPCYQKDLK